MISERSEQFLKVTQRLAKHYNVIVISPATAMSVSWGAVHSHNALHSPLDADDNHYSFWSVPDAEFPPCYRLRSHLKPGRLLAFHN